MRRAFALLALVVLLGVPAAPARAGGCFVILFVNTCTASTPTGCETVATTSPAECRFPAAGSPLYVTVLASGAAVADVTIELKAGDDVLVSCGAAASGAAHCAATSDRRVHAGTTLRCVVRGTYAAAPFGCGSGASL